MNYYDSNLSALLDAFPGFSEEVFRQTRNSAELTVSLSRSGLPTASRNGIYLHSRFDPRREAQQVIDIAREYGALGWKVNGAGGEGGSVTILSGPSMSRKRSMLCAVEQTNPLFQNIPIYLSRFGLRVWSRPCDGD